MARRRSVLFLVDAQNDFYIQQEGRHRGALVVPGAEASAGRITTFIGGMGRRLGGIFASLDSHQGLGIERPPWWKLVNGGTPPDPFTVLGVHPDGIRVVAYVPGTGPSANALGMVPTEIEYTTFDPGLMHRGGVTGQGSLGYLRALEARKRYPHVVWPVHCVVGAWGASLVPGIADALLQWEIMYGQRVRYVAKGNNPHTESFSVVMAEVPDPRDPSTQVNTGVISDLENADTIYLAGEARSHCLANTGYDIAANFRDPAFVSKIVLLTDCTNDVPGFGFLGEKFVTDMVARGMRTATSAEVLAGQA